MHSRENPDHNAEGGANQPDQNNDNNAPLVLQMQLLISLQINLFPNSHPTTLHHNSPSSSTCSSTVPSTATYSSKPAGPLQPVPNWPQALLHQPAPQIIHQQMVNWSHFKPEFAGTPEEDTEAHLLHTNDWMQTHSFEENVKVDFA